jgi:hypothetical protein
LSGNSSALIDFAKRASASGFQDSDLESSANEGRPKKVARETTKHRRSEQGRGLVGC